MNEPIWISRELALAVHARQLSEHGGGTGIRDMGLLDSALARPQQLFAYGSGPSIAELAASLAFGLARNHPFVDGNKRTAVVLCEVFVVLNGGHLAATDTELLQTFIALAAGELSEESLASWLDQRIKSDADQVHEP